ncbi:sorting nexin-19-like isoform X2 [Anneissia japonica]|uniref:sorting nexin-19-like isoform X2 n=1 Tax=Anneissia japonica TaxID=1529436 RepID=UPI0014258B6E|nr:sorting nexin-19-like isoform X2 [Anneissia japonica]
MAYNKLYKLFDQYCQRLTTHWQQLTTLHRAFVLSGLVFLLSCVATLPGLLTVYFLSILSALAIAKTLNESNSFQPSNRLLKYVYFVCNFYFQQLPELQMQWLHWKINTDQSPGAAERGRTRKIQTDTYERHSESSYQKQLCDTHSENLKQLCSLPNEEIRFRNHIFNDFILSWYTSLSLHQQVPDEFLVHITYLLKSFTNYSKKIDVYTTVNRILFELRKHLCQYRTSSLKLKQLPLNSRSTLADVYANHFNLHPAIQDQRFMEDYIRQVTNVLMWCLLPSHVYRCYTGNLLLQEILTCNVFISLTDLLSDPNTLNEIILLVLNDNVSMSSDLLYLVGGLPESFDERSVQTEVKHKSSKDLKECKNLSNQFVAKKQNTSNIPLVDGDNDQELKGEELRDNYSSDSDDQKVLQTSQIASRPKSLDWINPKQQNSLSAISQQGFPSSPTKPALYRSKSSPVISLPPVKSTFKANIKSENSYVVPMTEMAPSVSLKRRASLTSLVSFQSIPVEEGDDELWFLEGEENVQDVFVIPKDPGRIGISGTQDDQLIMYGRPHEGFASDTLKMLHGMMDTALSKLPSMEANPAEKIDEEDGVFTNIIENIKQWKTSFEDDLLDENDLVTNENKPSEKVESLNGLVLPEGDDQSNWGHDFLNEQEKKAPSVSKTRHKDVKQKEGLKHCNSLAVSHHQADDDSKSARETAADKRAKYGLSRSKTLAVLEGVTDQYSDIEKERSVWIQSMLIIDTETMKDQRNISKDYTLYCIKYQALIWKGDEQPTEAKTHLLKRRFREFTNLQSRLEENPRLKPLLKGIRDVPRKLQLVNRMSEDVVLHRKQSLERYLQNLCSIPAICSSREFQEFIAIEGDTHIEYVKKAPEIVPRIDKDSYFNELEKFFMRGMSGIMGTLKSKLPSSTALPANPALAGVDQGDTSQHSDSAPETSTSTSPFAEVENSGPQRSYDFRARDTSVEKNVDVLLKSFLESKAREASIDRATTREAIRQKSKPKEAKIQDVEDDKNELNYTEIPLADMAMCLTCEILHDYGNWIVKETTQQIVAVAFGKLLNKLLEDSVDELLKEDMCARYLRLIRKSLWPNGQLLSQQNPPKTDEEKETARRNAFHRVKDFIPGIVNQVVGEEELENCLLSVHASLQDPKLNRHLVFTLIDILLDAFIPGIEDPNIREKFIQEAAL